MLNVYVPEQRECDPVLHYPCVFYRVMCDTFCLGVVLGLQTPGRVGSGGTVSEYLLVLVVGVGPCGAVSYPGRCVESPQ